LRLQFSSALDRSELRAPAPQLSPQPKARRQVLLQALPLIPSTQSAVVARRKM
jgi:hypothetical protein